MKNKFLFLIAFTILYLGEAKAQIGIGTNTPDASAVLEIKAGLAIYNSTTNTLELAISGSLWVNVIFATTNAVASGTTSSTGKFGIRTTSLDANAILDINSTTNGVLLPRSSTDPTGVEGMIYYNTTADMVKLYNGSSWIELIN
jgi:hypothetical protein